MSDLDALIYNLAGLAFLIALAWRGNLVPVMLLCLSFIFNELVFIANPTWSQLEAYFFAHAAKDFLISVALFLIYRPSAFILALTFIASCLFHKCAQIEVANEVLELKHIRTEFMTYITAFQIATIYTSFFKAGGINGGKCVRHFISYFRDSSFRIFHSKAFKVMP